MPWWLGLGAAGELVAGAAAALAGARGSSSWAGVASGAIRERYTYK